MADHPRRRATDRRWDWLRIRVPTGGRGVLTARYRPRHMPAWVGPALTVLTGATCLARGVDYLLYPPRDLGGVTRVVYDVAYPSLWGWAFTITGGGVLLALAVARLVPLVAAHVAGVFVAGTYTIALAQGSYVAGIGWHLAVSAAAVTAVHAIRALTLGREIRRVSQEALA